MIVPRDDDARAWRSARALRVLGAGRALPGPAIETDDLLDRVERVFRVRVARRGRAIARRLGIRARHLCRNLVARHESPRAGQRNADLAADAVCAALREAGLAPNDLAYLVAHTATPATLVPPSASHVADRLGYRGPYLELRQACTGFANALIVAQGLAATGAGPIAIVGSETGSVYFDPARADEEPSRLVNLVQMGDGAGAIVVAPDEGTGARIAHAFFGTAGLGRSPGLSLAGGSDAPARDGALEFAHDYAAVREGGPALFHHAAEAARDLGTPPDEADHVIPHQANGRMAALVGPALGVDPRRVFVNADRVGNTGSAAMWIALAELRPRLAPGARVVALGAEATKFMFGGFAYAHG